MMEAAGLPVYAIQGQHDEANPPWPVAVDPYVMHVDKTVFEPIPGIRMYGLDRRTPENIKAELEAVPAEVNTVLLHQLAHTAFPMDGAWDLEDGEIPGHITRAFIGDYHEPVDFPIPGGHAWYSGSTHLCSISEPEEKGFLDLVPVGDDFEVRRIKLDTRKVHRLNISDDDQLDQVVELLQKIAQEERPAPRYAQWPVTRPIVTVQYLTSVRHVSLRVVEAAKDSCILWLMPTQVRSEAATDASGLSGDSGAKTLTSCLTEVCPMGDTHDMTLELLQSGNAIEVFERWRERYKVA